MLRWITTSSEFRCDGEECIDPPHKSGVITHPYRTPYIESFNEGSVIDW